MLEIKFDDEKLKKIQRELRAFPKALPKVMSRGLNRTATSARTEISRSLAGRIGLRIKDVRDKLSLQRATYSNWRSAVGVSGKKFGLIKFGARQTKKGVTYRLKQKRVLIRHAFIASMKTGHRGVFLRKGAARLPIQELRGPSLAQVYTGAQDQVNRIQAESAARLAKNIYDQVNLILKRRLSA